MKTHSCSLEVINLSDIGPEKFRRWGVSKPENPKYLEMFRVTASYSL